MSILEPLTLKTSFRSAQAIFKWRNEEFLVPSDETAHIKEARITGGHA